METFKITSSGEELDKFNNLQGVGEKSTKERNLDAKDLGNEQEVFRHDIEPEITHGFQQAIEETLLGKNVADKKSLSYSNLTPYEKTLLEKENLKINLLIDMDGVLLNTEQEIKDILSILTQDVSVGINLKEAFNRIKDSKIPFGVLKTLLTARQKVENLIIVTDRLGFGPCLFPCFGMKKKNILKNHGIETEMNTLKMFSSGKKFIPIIKDSDITYYVGSSNTDDEYIRKIKTAMEKSGVEKEKLWYMKVHIDGKESVL